MGHGYESQFASACVGGVRREGGTLRFTSGSVIRLRWLMRAWTGSQPPAPGEFLRNWLPLGGAEC